MNHRPLIILAALVFAPGFVTSAHAQSNTPAGTAPAPEQPAPPSSSASTPAPAKKVWTNEDVPVLRNESEISTVGNSNNNRSSSKTTSASKNNDGKGYQAQIARLQAQIPPIDAQIAELQAAIDGKPTGDAKVSKRPTGVKADDWSVEMQQLQQKKDGILTQISALQDQARHQGVPANTLP